MPTPHIQLFILVLALLLASTAALAVICVLAGWWIAAPGPLLVLGVAALGPTREESL